MILQNLQKKYKDCNKCNKCMCSYKVFGYGNINADIMVVGESPGETEIRTGVPFTGAAGQLLNNILKAISLEREDLYFTNVIVCRTNEKNRTPSWSESQNCAERLNEEINIVKPNIILMVGSPSLKRFFGKDSRVMESHGRWFLDFKPPYARYFSIMHPNWILYSTTLAEEKAKKKTMWEDIKTFATELKIADFILKRTKEEKCIE